MRGGHTEITILVNLMRCELRGGSRCFFLIGGFASAAAVVGYIWVWNAKGDEIVKWPQRKILDLNGRIAGAYVSNYHLMPSYSKGQIEYLKPNGDIGLGPAFDFNSWKLQVDTGMRGGKLNL